GPLARLVGAPRQHLRQDGTPPREARARPRDRARVVGHAHPDRQVQCAARRPDGRAPASGSWWQAAAHPVRHAGVEPAADVRALHDRVPRPAVPPLHPATPARDLRLRGHAHQREYAGAGEAQALGFLPGLGVGRRFLVDLRLALVTVDETRIRSVLDRFAARADVGAVSFALATPSNGWSILYESESPARPYFIGSITKLYTAAIIM